MHLPGFARPARFFALTFALSWTVWIVLHRLGVVPQTMALPIGTWGPTAAALILTTVEEGRAGLRRLLGALTRWRVNPGWYVFALFATVPVAALAVAAHRWLGGSAVQTNDPAQWYLAVPAFAQILVLGVLGEELGWRGYALPRLQQTIGALGASLVIGTVWGIWHLPLWWLDGNFHTGIPFALFVVQDIALSIVITWLYIRTGGSVLLVAVFHAASNLTIGIAPLLPQQADGSLRPLVFAVVVLCAGAGSIALHWMRGSAQKPPR